MTLSIKKMWSDNKVGMSIGLIVLAYGIYMVMQYLGRKGLPGFESNSKMQPQYKNSGSSSSSASNQAVRPSDPNGNEVFASANNMQTSMPGLPTSCSKPSIQNPAELLPKDTNAQWAALNPSGKGELANVNLLKAGYHIGIDTVGQTLKNANLQIRSEPPNPQLNSGPWNQSTITPDFQRVPLEIGSGAQ